MRESRVKPSGITGPALKDLHWVWKGLAAFALFLLVLIPLRYIYLWRTSPTVVSHTITAGRSVPQAVRTSTCPGEVIPLPLNAGWTELPKGISCRIVHQIEVGEVEFADHRGRYEARGWQARNPIKARATSGSAFMRISWCPHETGLQPIKWDCTPKT